MCSLPGLLLHLLQEELGDEFDVNISAESRLGQRPLELMRVTSAKNLQDLLFTSTIVLKPLLYW